MKDKVKYYILGLFLVYVLIVTRQPTSPPTPLALAPDPLNPLLFKPEDMGWPSESARVDTSWEDVLSRNVALDTIRIDAAAVHVNPKGGHDPRGGVQIIRQYANEVTSVEMFQKAPPPIKVYRPASFMPQMENIVLSCGTMSGGINGQNCTFVMQYGRYVISGGMFVDGEVLVMDDWETFLTIIQGRLIDVVNQETSP